MKIYSLALLLLLMQLSMEVVSQDQVKSTSGQYILGTHELETLTLEAELGNGESAYKIARHYLMLDGMSGQFLFWVKKASSSGSLIAQRSLADYYWDIEKNREKSIELYLQIIPLDPAGISMRVAEIYIESKLLEEAIKYLQISAGLGNSAAMSAIIDLAYSNNNDRYFNRLGLIWCLVLLDNAQPGTWFFNDLNEKRAALSRGFDSLTLASIKKLSASLSNQISRK